MKKLYFTLFALITLHAKAQNNIVQKDSSITKIDSLTLYFNLGLQCEANKKFFEALNFYDRAIIYNNKESYLYSKRAYVKGILENYDGSIEDNTIAIKLNSKFDAVSYYNRGYSKYMLGDIHGALEDYDFILKRDSSNYRVWSGRGLIFHEKQDYKEALSNFTYAIRLNPLDSTSFVNRGFTKEKLNDFEGAIMDYDSSINLMNIDNHYLYYRKGVCLHQLYKYEDAVVNLTKSIEIYPAFAPSYYFRGHCKIRSRNHNKNQDILSDFKTAIKLEPHSDLIYYFRAELFKKLGKYKLALKDYNEAIKINPDYSTSYLDRGHILVKLKKNNEALEDFTKCCSLSNNPLCCMKIQNVEIMK